MPTAYVLYIGAFGPQTFSLIVLAKGHFATDILLYYTVHITIEIPARRRKDNIIQYTVHYTVHRTTEIPTRRTDIQ